MSAGAMLLIRLVLLPFWRELPPREFRAWFAAHSGRIRGLMVPLGAAAAGSAIATTATELVTEREPNPMSLIAAGSAAGVVAVTLVVNEPANEKFAQLNFDNEETTRLLSRWGRWHDLRVALGILAAIAAGRASLER
jgi:hypothetical protein